MRDSVAMLQTLASRWFGVACAREVCVRSTGSGRSVTGSSDGGLEGRCAHAEDQARLQGLDALVQIVYTAGVSLRVTAGLSNQPDVVDRLERIGDDLDAIVRHVWQAGLPGNVPLGPSDPPAAGSPLTRGIRSTRLANPDPD